MKKSLPKTKVTVKLRKSDHHDNEWYLMLESYPVYEPFKDKPQRKFEALNRVVHTPIWDYTDKKQKPHRDANGIIQCRSEADQEACRFADKCRIIRQQEADNATLFSDNEKEMAEQNIRSKQDFIAYFKKISKTLHEKDSDIIINWNCACRLLSMFNEEKPLPFGMITVKLMEDFKRFLLTAPQGGNKKGTISNNTASTYFSIFKAALKQAFIDEYLTIDISAKVKNIPWQEVRREHLTLEELNKLAATPCDRPVLKRAALFSALTGLRHCDIQKLKWSEVVNIDGQWRLDFRQKKTKGVEYMPISNQAYELCGERKDPERCVFEDLPDPSWISDPLKKWVKAAGITKHITFHCFRHTFATLQLSNGTDIYTVSKMMGHTNVRTTQLYTKVVDEKKVKAADAIKIDPSALDED